VSSVAAGSIPPMAFESGGAGTDRNGLRLTGWMIAISASTVLWSVVGVGVWSITSFLR
jgi:hypothetical protein